MNELEIRLFVGDHLPSDAPVSWRDLPGVSVTAKDDRPLREVFEEALTRFAEVHELSYYGGNHKDIHFCPYVEEMDANVFEAIERDVLYGVGTEGELILDDEDVAFLRVGDLRRAAESDYAPYDPTRILVYEKHYEGAGGGPDFILAQLYEHWEFLAGYGFHYLGRLIPALWYRRIRRQARQWQRQGIPDMEYIRGFFAKRDYWTPSQVGKLVSLDDDSAARMLIAMGYIQLDTGLYVLGVTEEAMEKRERWIRCEQTARIHPRRRWPAHPGSRSRQRRHHQ